MPLLPVPRIDIKRQNHRHSAQSASRDLVNANPESLAQYLPKEEK